MITYGMLLFVICNILTLRHFTCGLSLRFEGTDMLFITRVNETGAIRVVETTSSCKCRQICLAIPECRGYAMELVPSGIKCMLTDQYEGDVSEIIAIPGEYGGVEIGSDNLIYWKAPIGPTSFTKAQTKCEEKGGFKIGIYKTLEQFQVLKDFQAANGETWVNMEPISSTQSNGVWADGTMYTDTEIGKAATVTISGNECCSAKFRFTGTAFFDIGISAILHVLCQWDPVTQYNLA